MRLEQINAKNTHIHEENIHKKDNQKKQNSRITDCQETTEIDEILQFELQNYPWINFISQREKRTAQNRRSYLNPRNKRIVCLKP